MAKTKEKVLLELSRNDVKFLSMEEKVLLDEEKHKVPLIAFTYPGVLETSLGVGEARQVRDVLSKFIDAHTVGMKDNHLLSSHEAGALLQMDASSIVKWVNDGILPAYRTPGGHRRIRVSDLRDFLRKHNMFIPPELGGTK